MCSIGIDIGGTKIKVVLWNGKKITAFFGAKTPKTKKEFIKTLKTAVKRLVKKSDKIGGIGIGAAGIISKNKIVFCPNIPYLKNFSFSGVFPRMSVKIDNDARAFLRGELKFGAGRGAKKVLAFTIGTGIGRAFAENGKVKKIKKFEYPEIWEKEYQWVRDSETAAVLAEFLDIRLAAIIKKYNPRAVIIGGGILKRKNFFRRLKNEMEKRTKKNNGKIKFKKAVLGDSAAPIGAALS